MTPTFAVDTSCIVAAVCAWHTCHERALKEIDRRLGRGERLTISTQALLETYAVLTRLPAPYRLSPRDAWSLIEANIVRAADVVALDADTCIRIIKELADHGLGGGRTYDAVTASGAAASRARVLLTFNRRHFEPSPPGIEVVVPE